MMATDPVAPVAPVAPVDTADNEILELSRRLDTYHIEYYKIACRGLNVEKYKVDNCKDNFGGLLEIVRNKLPDEAVIFTCEVLKISGFNDVQRLMKYAECTNYNIRTKHQLVDCRITVLSFLNDLVERDFNNIRTRVCSHKKLSEDYMKTRSALVEVLFDERVINEDNTEFVYKIAKIFNRHCFFDEYYMRHPIVVPGILCIKYTHII